MSEIINKIIMIILIEGATGSLKSWLTTHLGRMAWKRGSKIYSNYKLNFSDTNDDIFLWHNLYETYHLTDGVLLIDDAIKLLNAQKWYNLPQSFVEKIAGSRHDHLDIITNIQSFYQIDNHIRDNVHLRYKCTSIFRFPLNDSVKPYLQISVVTAWKKFDDAKIERIRWRKVGYPKFYFISRFWSREYYKTYENIYLSQYICSIKMERKNITQRKPLISGKIYSRDLVNQGKARI